MILDSRSGVAILWTMKSRMNREVHSLSRFFGIRFCERFRGEIPLYLLDCSPLLMTQSLRVKFNLYQALFKVSALNVGHPEVIVIAMIVL